LLNLFMDNIYYQKQRPKRINPAYAIAVT